MTIEFRVRIETFVPEERYDKFRTGLMHLVQECGGTFSMKVNQLSPELLRLGLPSQVVEALVARVPSINTVEQLVGLTEAELLATPDISYGGLYVVEIRLNEAGLAPAGKRLEDFDGSVEALLERLSDPIVTYRQLKLDGINSVAQILAMEYADARKRPWWNVVKRLLGGRRLRPTSLDRPIKDLSRHFDFRHAEAAGLRTVGELVSLSASQLEVRLSKYSGSASSGHIGIYIEEIIEVLMANGLSLAPG